MSPYPDPTPCAECGAHVGHRMVATDFDANDTAPGSKASRPCSLGLDLVPRAEHERAKKERDEALVAAGWKDVRDRPLSAMDIIGRDRDEWKARAEGERRAHTTTNLYTARIEAFNDRLRAGHEELLTKAAEAVTQSIKDRRALELKDKELHDLEAKAQRSCAVCLGCGACCRCDPPESKPYCGAV